MTQENFLSEKYVKRHFISKVSYSAALMFLGALLWYFLNVYLARTFSKEEYGDISVALALFYGSMIPLLTISSGRVASRFIPLYIEKKLWSRFRYFFNYYSGWTIILSGGLLAAGFIFESFFSSSFSPKIHFVLSFLWVAPIIAFSSFSVRLIESVGKQVESIFLNYFLFYTVFFGFLFLIEFLLKHKITTNFVFIAVGLGELCSIFFSLLLILRFPVIYAAKQNEDISEKETWLKRSREYTITDLLMSVFICVELFTLEFLGSHKGYAGAFSAMSAITRYLFIFTNASVFVLRPAISSFLKEDKKNDLQSIYNRSFLLSVTTTVVIAFILIFFRQVILSHFGSFFLKDSSALLVVIIAQSLLSILSSGVLVLRFSSDSVKASIYIATAIVINFFSILFLVPRIGLIGVGYSMIISFFIYGFLVFTTLKIKTGIKPLIFF